MSFEIKDVLLIIGIVVSTLATFFSTRHNMKEYVRDKIDEHKKESVSKNGEFNKEIMDLKLNLKDLENKDNSQQQAIDQLQVLYPTLLNIIHNFSKETKS